MKRRYTLGVNCADLALHHGRSIGIYNLTMGLLQPLSGRDELRLRIYGNVHCKDDLPANAEFIPQDAVVASKVRRVIWEQAGLALETVKRPVDAVLLPKGMCPAVVRPRAKIVSYIHDGIHRFYRKFYPGYLPLVDRTYSELGIASSLRRADAILVNSEFTAGEVRAWAAELGVAPPPITVAGCGFAVREVLSVSEPLDRQGVLVVAGVAPHKNAGRALDFVHRAWANSGRAFPVTVLGTLPADSVRPDGWKFVRGISNAAVTELYRAARAVVYFSEYEGFGMPPVEATIEGAAAVYSSIPALREVMGGGGFAFDNSEFESFERALNSALSCDAVVISHWSAALSERHSWSKVADRVLDCVRSVCSG